MSKRYRSYEMIEKSCGGCPKQPFGMDIVCPFRNGKYCTADE
jgi:hypothetical protein